MNIKKRKNGGWRAEVYQKSITFECRYGWMTPFFHILIFPFILMNSLKNGKYKKWSSNHKYIQKSLYLSRPTQIFQWINIISSLSIFSAVEAVYGIAYEDHQAGRKSKHPVNRRIRGCVLGWARCSCCQDNWLSISRTIQKDSIKSELFWFLLHIVFVKIWPFSWNYYQTRICP